ncbi:class I SAM-dependent methyltransferase [Salibacterium salarium]|uniref:Class I SAM-dependent methyltransferase n=1 Tax=Salibacterium salarium TaxID=284579 RepID=A0A3R9RA06_9BACI|nr:class I SAM-dependent methyltransferase [Salibacterium salarium]RSL30600.1 class I SAM-dependent methyltransferase [Salibacterium salarium]
MQTSWKEKSIADDFEAYNDTLEENLGFRFIFEYLNKKEIGTILDYGCGPGKVAYRLAQNHKKEVIAVDESKEMIQIANQKRSHDLVNYHLIKEDNLSFLADDSVDAAMVCYVFINTAEERRIKRIMTEIHRVLKPGGNILVLDTNPSSTGIPFYTFQNGETGRTYGYGESRKEWLNLPNGEKLVLHDFHWPKFMYKQILKEVGFFRIDQMEPTLYDIPKEEISEVNNKFQLSELKNEWNYPPFVIFKAHKASNSND